MSSRLKKESIKFGERKNNDHECKEIKFRLYEVQKATIAIMKGKNWV